MTIDLTQRLRDRVAIVTGGASGIGSPPPAASPPKAPAS